MHMVSGRFGYVFFVLVFSVLSVGCVTNSVSSFEEGVVTNVGPLPVTALEVHRVGEYFFFKLQQESRILYAGGNWNVSESSASAWKQQQYAPPSLVPLHHYQTAPWGSLPSKATQLPVLGVAQWRQLRDRMFSSLIPRDKSGLVLNFEHEDYFLFYDDHAKFQATRLVDKPGDYGVKSYVHFEQFVRHAGQVLKEYLSEQGIAHTEFIFNTGDEGLYSLPFLYVNTDSYQLVFFRNVPLGPVNAGTVPGLKSGQTVGHVLRSHIENAYNRPVSSLFRLFTVISDTAVTTAKFEWATALSNEPVPPLGSSSAMDLQAWEHYLDSITSYTQSNGSVDFLVDGEAFFTRFIDAASAAEKSIHMQVYIFDNDDYALRIADLLKRRSNEGVNVKVLFDGLGTITATMSDSASLPEDYEPPFSVRQYLQDGSKVNVRQKDNPWLTGDHVKSTIIDRDVAFVGGMNIGREYRYDWHDLMMELHGPVVETIEQEFSKAWSHAGPLGDLGYLVSQARIRGRHEGGNESSALRVLLTSSGTHEIYKTQLEAIKRAQKYIYIQNSYITNDLVLRELVKARRRGVDVRVITALETDHGPITSSNVLAVNVMLENGIRVYVYPGFSHVKAAIFDGWVCVGSANFDRLSLRLNRELNIASSDPKIERELLDTLFLPDFRRSPELTEPLPERWLDHLEEILSDYVY